MTASRGRSLVHDDGGLARGSYCRRAPLPRHEMQGRRRDPHGEQPGVSRDRVVGAAFARVLYRDQLAPSPAEGRQILDDGSAPAVIASGELADVVAGLDLSRISVRVAAAGDAPDRCAGDLPQRRLGPAAHHRGVDCQRCRAVSPNRTSHTSGSVACLTYNLTRVTLLTVVREYCIWKPESPGVRFRSPHVRCPAPSSFRRSTRTQTGTRHRRGVE